VVPYESHKLEVAGSNPAPATKTWSSIGRIPDFHSGKGGFDSPSGHQLSGTARSRLNAARVRRDHVLHQSRLDVNMESNVG
jgi:hypothetical protein